MISRKSGQKKLKAWGFLLGIEVDEEVITPEKVCNRLADALTHVDGVGPVDVDFLGEIDDFNDEEAN